jgi:hypothetical protein
VIREKVSSRSEADNWRYAEIVELSARLGMPSILTRSAPSTLPIFAQRDQHALGRTAGTWSLSRVFNGMRSVATYHSR